MTFAQETTDQIRRDQQDAARRLAAEEARPTLRLAPSASRPAPAAYRTTNTTAPEKKKNVLKGHEAFLKALEMNGAKVEVEKKDGTVYRGTLKHTDKFTLTVNVTERGNVDDEGVFTAVAARDRVIFKHDMSEFSALTQRPVAAPAAEGSK